MIKKLLVLIFLTLIPLELKAGCDDPIGDGVDYTNCRFSDGQDLAGSYLPNSNLSFATFIQVNFDKLFLKLICFINKNLTSLLIPIIT